VDFVTAAVTSRRESAGRATSGVGVTPDDDVDGQMTKTDTCYSLLSPDVSVSDEITLSGLLDLLAFPSFFCML